MRSCAKAVRASPLNDGMLVRVGSSLILSSLKDVSILVSAAMFFKLLIVYPEGIVLLVGCISEILSFSGVLKLPPEYLSVLQLLRTDGKSGVSMISNKGLDVAHLAILEIFHLSNIADRSCTVIFCSIPLVQVPKFLGEGLSSINSKASTSSK
jgi:hypothetical protein